MKPECDAARTESAALRQQVERLRSLCIRILGTWVRHADGEDGGDFQKELIVGFRREWDALALSPPAPEAPPRNHPPGLARCCTYHCSGGLVGQTCGKDEYRPAPKPEGPG